MNRDVDISEISDGKFYGSGDMVKCGTNGCKGCSECCRQMCDTIVLDPWDIFHLQQKTGMDFMGLLQGYLELRVVDGLILPTIKYNERTGGCSFLDEAGRCTVHDARPGFCRLFPLGRYYENRDFSYILQVGECPVQNMTKVKVKKWLGIPDLASYEDYIRGWHFFIRDIEAQLDTGSPELRKQVTTWLLKEFYQTAWDQTEDFYSQFAPKLKEGKHYMGFAQSE